MAIVTPRNFPWTIKIGISGGCLSILIFFYKINLLFMDFIMPNPYLSRTTGLYAHTLAKIILHDVTRSMAVFIVIFFSFCGALTLSLCYSGSNENQELRCVSVEYISLTKLWSCFGKNNLEYRLLQVNKIFDNFLWNLLNLICSLIARCFIYSTYSHPFWQKQFTDRGNLDVECSAWEVQKNPTY